MKCFIRDRKTKDPKSAVTICQSLAIYGVLLIISLLLALAAPYSVYSQWIDKGDYKEINASNTAIKQIVQVEGEPFFWMMTTDIFVKKYDYSGNYVKSFHSDSLTWGFQNKQRYQFGPILLSSDGKSLITTNAFICRNSSSAGLSMECNVFNLDSSKMKINNYSLICMQQWGGQWAENYNIFLKYINYINSKNSIISCGGWSYTLSSHNYIWNRYNYFGNYGFNLNFSISKTNKYYIGCKYFLYGESYHDPMDPSKNYSSFSEFSTFELNTHLLSSIFIPSQCVIANYDTTFVAQTDSTLYFYKFTQNADSAWRTGQLTLPYKPINYIGYDIRYC
ncbi:MAG: hypothetical protein NT007_06950 [Candidatus Kapabacteria bacterium]|nr:hypothetical protein [Candidatus Kapabacteria bacterium]